jgi:hypothetical protein
MIASEIKDLWGLYHYRQGLDPGDLVQAIEDQARSGDLDYRTRLLIQESVEALRNYWGETRLSAWLTRSPVRQQLKAILGEHFDEDRGFPSLRRRVMAVTRPETIQAFFRDLGTRLRSPLRIHVGDSAACILPGYLSRKTEDIDIVDEIPTEIRAQHQLLDELHKRYDLKLGHFQQHYLPTGWQNRVHWQEPAGQLQIFLIDVVDVFLSKLTSIREKDKDDLVRLAPQLDKEMLTRRLQETMQSMLAAPSLREHAEKNWYILYGEPLPT